MVTTQPPPPPSTRARIRTRSKRSFERAFGSASTSDPSYVQHLRSGLSHLEECIREIRRISHDLKPALPADQPFVEALSRLAREFAECTQLNVQIDGLDAGIDNVRIARGDRQGDASQLFAG